MLRITLGMVCLGVLVCGACSDGDDDPAGSGGASSGGKSGGGTAGAVAQGGKSSGGASTNGGKSSGGASTNGGKSSGGASTSGGKSSTSGGQSSAEGGTHSPAGGAAGEAGSWTDSGGSGGTTGGSSPGNGGTTGGVFPGSGGEGGAVPTCSHEAGGVGGGIGGEGSLGPCENATVWACDANIQQDFQLEALRGVGVIQGDLILDADVSSLEPLACLTRVTGSIISKSEALPNFKGLENLKQVDGDLRIEALYSLTRNVDGLESLAKIGGQLYIAKYGFSPSSETCCFQYLPTSLDSLSGLHNLRSLGSLLVARTGLRDLDGLQKLTELGSLILLNNFYLTSLHGLEGITRVYSTGSGVLNYGKSVTAGVLIGDQRTLASLDGLQLKDVTSLQLTANAALADVHALESIQTLQSFTVTSNPVLDTCQVNQVVAQIDSVGATTISGNKACAP